MISLILSAVSNFVLFVIAKAGYGGIFLLMFLQSFNIPAPSEITMSFSGFLASQGVFNFWIVVFTGTFGNLAGAFFSYMLAETLIRNGLREKFRLLKILISDGNLNRAQRWFEKYGSVSVFFGRLLPVVSTFISFPAGLAKMKISRFLLLTFFGSLLWTFILTKLGFILGQNWTMAQAYFRKFDYLILILILMLLIFWIYRHIADKSNK